MTSNLLEYTKIWNLGDDRASEVLELFGQSWWAHSRKIEDTRKVLEGSDLTFGLLSVSEDKLIGFARVITDFVYKATVYDVIVHKDFQGLNLGRVVMDSILNHPYIKEVEHIELYCNDSMLSFYKKFHFCPIQPQVYLLRKG